jgi:Phytanoyl-CoA dioxygenase (PhyH)
MSSSTGDTNGPREVLDGSAPRPPSVRLPDPDASRILARAGWVVVDLLDAEEINAVERAFDKIAGASNVPMYSSWWQPLEERRATDAAIRSVVLPRLRDLLPEFEMVFSGFMAKTGSSETAFPIHQDPTLVDEGCFASLTFWSPLMDVGTETGCMHGIPGSHRFDDGPRPAFSPFPYQASQGDLSDLLQPIPMRAGQVLLFHPGIFHASPPNLGHKRRIAWAGMVVPEKAQVRYCRRRDAMPVIDVYAVEPGFYVRARPEDGTDHLHKIAEVATEPRPLDIEALTVLAACVTA